MEQWRARGTLCYVSAAQVDARHEHQPPCSQSSGINDAFTHRPVDASTSVAASLSASSPAIIAQYRDQRLTLTSSRTDVNMTVVSIANSAAGGRSTRDTSAKQEVEIQQTFWAGHLVLPGFTDWLLWLTHLTENSVDCICTFPLYNCISYSMYYIYYISYIYFDLCVILCHLLMLIDLLNGMEWLFHSVLTWPVLRRDTIPASVQYHLVSTQQCQGNSSHFTLCYGYGFP